MTKRTWPKWGLTLAAALALQACGGGGGGGASDPGTPVPDVRHTSVVDAQGVVYDAQTGKPLEGVTIQIGNITLLTNSEGQFGLQTAGGQSIEIQASLTGYSTGQTSLNLNSDGNGSTTIINLIKVGTVTPVTIAAGGTVTLAGSNAQVTLPAAGLVDAVTGQAATGTVNVSLTPIDPASQPRSMPGTYRASNDVAIESFGAIQVELRDAAGKPLQLATGKTATIRIPLRTRSSERPATIPLYYFKESTGKWVQDGSATLKGDANNGFYYEGTVTHFSSWNADKPIDETVFVKGCVRNSDGAIPTEAITIATDGLDYSGVATADLAADGSFRVPLKRRGRVTLLAEGLRSSALPVTLEPSDKDIDLSTKCLVLSAPPLAPLILLQPIALGPVFENEAALLLVGARGAGQLRFQWQRNGQDLPGQTFPILRLPKVTMADNGAAYTVVVTNQAGSKKSDAHTLQVLSGDQAIQQAAFIALFTAINQIQPLSMVALSAVDVDTGRMLASKSMCQDGSVEGRLDGVKTNGGEPIDPGKPHQLQLGFNQCVILEDDGQGQGTLTGSVSSDFRYDIEIRNKNEGFFTLNASSQLTQLTNAAIGLRASGTFASVLTSTDSTTTPTSGATLTRFANGISGNTLTITGGNIAVTGASSILYNDLTFTLNGASYVFSGTMSFPTASGDALTLSSGGKVIGRFPPESPKPGILVDVTGTIPSF